MSRAQQAEIAIRCTMMDPSSSFPLQRFLETALRRDPVDAAGDAETAARLLGELRDAVLAETSL